jgi:hypothetical protein
MVLRRTLGIDQECALKEVWAILGLTPDQQELVAHQPLAHPVTFGAQPPMKRHGGDSLLGCGARLPMRHQLH